MILVKSPNLVNDLNAKYLFMDTNVLVSMIKYPTLFADLLEELALVGCAFLTIPQVIFEFTRGTETVTEYKKRVEFAPANNITVYPIDRHLGEFKELPLIVHKVSRGISYTDYLLCVCLCKFSSAYLISEDRDIPTALFDRKHIVTVDTDKDLRTFGIYAHSEEKLELIADSVS